MFRKRGPVYTFGREPFRVELLTQPTAVDFAECYDRRVEADVDGVRVAFISFDDLLANKTASGRIKDLGDIEKLRKKKRLKSAKPPRKRKGQA